MIRNASLAAVALAATLAASCVDAPTHPDLQPEPAPAGMKAEALAQPNDFDYEIVRHPDAGNTFVNRINARGELAGDFCAADGSWCWGFVRRGDDYRTVAYPGSSFTFAYGLNERGDVVGVFGDATGEHAYIQSRGEYRALPAPAGTQTRAYDIGASGIISGSYRGPSDAKWQPAIWGKDGSFTPLSRLVTALGADMAEGFGTNVRGEVVGHFTRAGDLDATTGRQKMYGFVYTDGEVRATLDYPGSGWMSCGWGIGAEGTVLGHYVDLQEGGVTGYQWEDGRFTARLRVPGALNTFPQAITPAGAIAGWAFVPGTGRVGFVAQAR